MRTATNTVKTTAAALLAAAVMVPMASANITKSYTSATNNTWYITGMPDFDQKRSYRPANSPFNGLAASAGLPNQGRMYCVPTATLNLIAYAASHGYPNVSPGDHSYSYWLDPDYGADGYDEATQNLAWLGALMGTSPEGGTGLSGWYNGTENWLPDNQFDVGIWGASSSWAPRAQHVGQMAQNGALVGICYGRYEYETLNNFASQLVERQGGHCVTPRRIDIQNSTTAEIWIRNPSSSNSESWWRQSPFTHQDLDFTDSFYSMPGTSNRIMSRLSFGTGDGKVRLLDSAIAIWPKQGLTSDPAGHTFAIDTLGGGFGIQEQGVNSQPVQVSDIVPGSVLVDFEQSPMRSEIAGMFKDIETGEMSFWILDANAVRHGIGSATGGAGGAGKVKFDRLSIKKFTYSPEGVLFGMNDTELLKIFEVAIDSDGDGVVDGSDYALWRESFGATAADGSPIVPSDIQFDDATGTIRVLFPTIGEVRGYKWSASGDADDRPTEEVAFYYNKVFSQDTEFAFDVKTGATVFSDNGSGELVGFLPCPNGELGNCQVAATLAAPGGGAGDMETDGKGNFYLVGDDGVVRCFGFDPDRLLVRNVDAPFDGSPAGSFQITRSRTNYDPSFHADWTNIPADELVDDVPEVRECGGDLTTTGATLPGQPGYGVPDATVDLDDLGFYLNNWVAGELLADVTTTGATLEGQPGFGIADGVTDLDDLGFFLNAWINGCN